MVSKKTRKSAGDPFIEHAAEALTEAWDAQEEKTCAARVADAERSIKEVEEALKLWGDTPLPTRLELVEALSQLADEVAEFRGDPINVELDAEVFDNVLKWVGRPSDVNEYLAATADTSFELLEMATGRYMRPYIMRLHEVADVLKAHPATKDAFGKRKQAFLDAQREKLFALPNDDSTCFIAWGDRAHAEEAGCVEEYDRREAAYNAYHRNLESDRIIITKQVKPAVIEAIFHCLGPTSNPEHWETMKAAKAEGLLHTEDVIELLWRTVFCGRASTDPMHVSSDHPDHSVFKFDPKATIKGVDQISVVAYRSLQKTRMSVGAMIDDANKIGDLATCILHGQTGLSALGLQSLFEVGKALKQAADGSSLKEIKVPYEVAWRYERVTSNAAVATTAVCRVTLVRAVTVEARFVLEQR